MKDRRVQREEEYAAQREASYQAYLCKEASAQQALKEQYTAAAAQHMQEYQQQQDAQHVAKQARHQEMAREVAWQASIRRLLKSWYS